MQCWVRQTINFFRKTKNTEKLTALLQQKEDILAVEIPVSLVYNGISHAVMMCSPNNLEDFALGFSLTEGIINKPEDIYGIDVVEVCNGIEVLWGSDNICIRKKKKNWRKKLAGAPVCGALAFLGGKFMQKWKMVGIGGKWSKIGFYFA